MIGRYGSYFGSHFSGARAGELIGVNANSEPRAAGRAENFARRWHVEYSRLAKDVTIFSELLLRDLRNHLVNHQIDITAWFRSKLVGNFVRPQKCRNTL